jgi:biotin carboxylase
MERKTCTRALRLFCIGLHFRRHLPSSTLTGRCCARQKQTQKLEEIAPASNMTTETFCTYTDRGIWLAQSQSKKNAAA